MHPGVVEPGDLAGRKVVLGPDDGNPAGGDHVIEDEAAVHDRPHRPPHVQVGHVLDEHGVLRGARHRVRDLALFVHGRPDLREQLGQVAEFHVVTRALDGAARGVPHHDDELRSGQVAGELDAANDVGVGDVAGDTHREDVAESLVEDELG